MKKHTSILSSLLATVLAFSLCLTSVPAYAAYAPDTNSPIIEQVVTDENIVHEVYRVDDNTVYSYDVTDDYVVSIGISGNTADYSIKYFSDSDAIVYHGITTINTNTYSFSNKLNMIKDALISGQLETEVISLVSSVSSSRSNDNDLELCKAALAINGEPSEYGETLRRSYTASGITAKVYESLEYQITDKFSWFAIIGTSLSAAMAALSAPASILLKIATWAPIGGGVYELLSDTTFRKYNLFGYYQKNIYAQGEFQFFNLKTRKFEAHVGDNAGVQYKSESKPSTFDDNLALCKTGIEEYQRKHNI